MLGGGGKEGQRGNPIYPETQAANESFFVNGEVAMLCQLGAFTAAVRILSGVFPEMVENVLSLESGMIANKSFIALPESAPNPAAALVLANYLSSPESHASKLSALGYAPGVDLPLLSPAQRQTVAAAPDLRGGTLEELARLEVPDTNAALVDVIQRVWVRFIGEGSGEPFEEIVGRRSRRPNERDP